MRGRALLRHLVGVLVLTVLVHAAPAYAEDRLALLIANAAYPDAEAPLPTAIRDAKALDDALSDQGFDTEVRVNLDKRSMRAALDALVAKITPGATVLLYFNGFGIEVRRQTYLVPTDATIWSEVDVAKDGFSLTAILDDIGRRGANVKIAIVDAARRNPFERRFRSYGHGLPALALSPQTLAIFAESPGKVGGDDTLFMAKLVAQLRHGEHDGAEVFTSARHEISEATKLKQVPWVASTLKGHFDFEGAWLSCRNRHAVRLRHWGSCRASPSTASADPAPQLSLDPPAPVRAPPNPRPVMRSMRKAASPPSARAVAEFPWPPPAPSTSYSISNVLLGRPATMGQVAETITRALEQAGYAERRYYKLPVDGIALATRLERINEDGSPGAPRWQTGEEKGLLDLVRGLFFTTPGHYRVIVFLIAREAPKRDQKETKIEEAKAWLKGGLDTVPREAGMAPYGDGVTLAYIYDFVSDGQKFVLDHEPLPGKDQLDRAGVLTALGAPRP